MEIWKIEFSNIRDGHSVKAYTTDGRFVVTGKSKEEALGMLVLHLAQWNGWRAFILEVEGKR